MPPTARTFHSDQAVSEVLGAILTFGITSVIVVVAMVGFNSVKDDAAERTIAVEGLAIANRVAADMADTGRFIERHGGVTTSYEHHLGLPLALEGRGYTVTFEPEVTTPPADAHPPRVSIVVQSLNADIYSQVPIPIPTSYEWCAGPDAQGASLRIVYLDAAISGFQGCENPSAPPDDALFIRDAAAYDDALVLFRGP